MHLEVEDGPTIYGEQLQSGYTVFEIEVMKASKGGLSPAVDELQAD